MTESGMVSVSGWFAFASAEEGWGGVGGPLVLAQGEGEVLGAGGEGEAAAPGQQGAPGGGAGAAPTGNPFGMIFWLLPALLIFMIVSSWLGGRKQRKQKQEMMSTLGRRDRVQTIGGIIGTVQDVSDHEVVLKVDEASNARVTFNKSAIQTVLRKAGGGDASGAPEPEMVQPAR